MARRKKIPECACGPCARFRVDGPYLYRNIERSELREGGDPEFLSLMKAHLDKGKGCDLCKKDYQRIVFVPQIMKEFLRLEHLCEWCRNTIQWAMYEHQWPICWGSTSDDEIKWFLLTVYLQKFNEEVRSLSPAQMAKDRAFQEWLDTLPKYDEPVEDLDIQLKPRFNIRRRVVEQVE